MTVRLMIGSASEDTLPKDRLLLVSPPLEAGQYLPTVVTRGFLDRLDVTKKVANSRCELQ